MKHFCYKKYISWNEEPLEIFCLILMLVHQKHFFFLGNLQNERVIDGNL